MSVHSLYSIPRLRRVRTSPPAARDGVWTTVSTALDATMMRAVRVVVERALIPSREDLEALQSSADHIGAEELLKDPRRFFQFVDEPAPPPEVKTTVRSRLLPGGAAYRRLIESNYAPYRSETPGVVGSIGKPRREPIAVEHWVHESTPARGTMIALHGFAMGGPYLGSKALSADKWFRRGLDVVLVTLPEHGVRRPAGARFSGECFAVPHVERLAEAVREAIYEIFTVRRWLRERSDAPVGLLGLSLGGYLTGLAVGLCDDFDFAIPMVPPACMGDLAWRIFRDTRHCRDAASAPIDEGQLRTYFRVHSPLAHARRVPKERILIVAGRGDRVVPPEHPTALWEHWGGPSIHWFRGSHIAPFGRAGVVQAIDRHLEGLGIL